MSDAGQTLRLNYDYSDAPTLEEFSLSDAFVRGIVGPIGSGKSSACAIEIVNRGREQEPGPDGIRRSRWCVVRNTYGELQDTTIKTFFQWFPPLYFGRYHATDKRYEIKAFPNTHIEVLFRALDKPEDARKLLSLELTGAWVNEAREVPWSIIEDLQGRLGRYPSAVEGGPTWYGLWMDTNPPDVDSKWYKFFEEKSYLAQFHQMVRDGAVPPDMRPEDYVRLFRQPGGMAANAENLSNLPGRRAYYVTTQVGKGKDWISVYVDAEYGFVMDGKPIFPEYNDKVHCQDIEPMEGLTVYRGWDFGLTPACVFSQVMPDGTWLIFEEMTTDRMGIERFADDVIARCGRGFPKGTKFRDIGDPAGNAEKETDERSVFQIMRAKGIDIDPGDQSLALRLESVRRPMTMLNSTSEHPQFILHSRCKVLRKGFKGAYNYKRIAGTADRYRDKPDKNSFSHPQDALQYVATHLFGDILRGQMPEEDDGVPEPEYGSDRGRSSVTGY